MVHEVTTNINMLQGRNTSLAVPSYILPLNFHFSSVLGLAMRYVSQINFLADNQRTEVVAENDDVVR